ncbi:MAG: NUDIX hydrolase [Acidobacteriaceae bacterium]
MSIRTISSKEVYRNPWATVREDVIERSNGVRGIYGVMDKDPASIVIPLESTPEGEFVTLVHQFRYTVQGTFFELPQGGWETSDVDIEEMARGELREETGLIADSMVKLGRLWIAYGAMRQEHHVFLAEGLHTGEVERDPEEHDMTVHRVRVEEFEEMLLDGRVTDNCTVAAWGLYLVWSRRKGTAGSAASAAGRSVCR